MKRLLVLAILIGALFLSTFPALAQTSCTWVGNYWNCTGPGGFTSCHWLGNYWVCN